jgi:hypothetical protein
MNSPVVYEVNCMLCGTEVGEIRDKRFVHQPGCDRPPTVRGGKLRCCRCGGSLYMERADTVNASLRARAAEEMARLQLARVS